MREAIGGTMLMYIVFIFLVVYIVFMAVVINYGRVFRTKNALISYIEVEEGFKTGIRENLISKARNEYGYYDEIYGCYIYDAAKDTTYYTIELAITFDIPLIGGNDEQARAIKIPITGETSAVRNVNEDNHIGINACAETGEKMPDKDKENKYVIANEVG